MFGKFLVKHFIKNSNNIKDKKVRTSYIYLGGIVGIITNLCLFGVKITIGILLNSIAVTADAINNLSDAGSSVITILGIKLASKPADKEHPFGYGRMEYLSGLIVSFMVILAGFEFIKASFEKILHPSAVAFDLLSLIFLLLSIAIKLWLGSFNKYVGKSINSSSLLASSFDAFSDAITSSCAVLSLFIAKFTSLPIDGYLGLIISAFILYAGFSLVKETINPLLGQAPDEELAKEILINIKGYDPIGGIHDLIIHNYGPGRTIASLHAEVPCDISLIKIHEIIDNAEKEISEMLNISLLIHIDPINTDSIEVAQSKEYTLEVLKSFPQVKSIHDFRIVGEKEFKNLIFDIVIDCSCHLDETGEKNLKSNINDAIKKIHPNYKTMITIDRDFYGVQN